MFSHLIMYQQVKTYHLLLFSADIDFNEINLQESKHTLQNTSQIEATGDGRTFSSIWAFIRINRLQPQHLSLINL